MGVELNHHQEWQPLVNANGMRKDFTEGNEDNEEDRKPPHPAPLPQRRGSLEMVKSEVEDLTRLRREWQPNCAIIKSQQHSHRTVDKIVNHQQFFVMKKIPPVNFIFSRDTSGQTYAC